MGMGAKKPKVQPLPPPPPPPEEDVSPEIRDARDRTKRAAAAAFGRRQTILAGAQGTGVGSRSMLGG